MFGDSSVKGEMVLVNPGLPNPFVVLRQTLPRSDDDDFLEFDEKHERQGAAVDKDSGGLERGLLGRYKWQDRSDRGEAPEVEG